MCVMRSFWKIFAALALMLPLGAFVAGNLVASAADDPDPARHDHRRRAERYAARRPVAQPDLDRRDPQRRARARPRPAATASATTTAATTTATVTPRPSHSPSDDWTTTTAATTTTPGPAGRAAAPTATAGPAGGGGRRWRRRWRPRWRRLTRGDAARRPTASGRAFRYASASPRRSRSSTFLALTGAGADRLHHRGAAHRPGHLGRASTRSSREFQKFQSTDGRCVPDACGALLDAFLESQVPADNEALVTWYDAGDGRQPQQVSADGDTGERQGGLRGGRRDDRRRQRHRPGSTTPRAS